MKIFLASLVLFISGFFVVTIGVNSLDQYLRRRYITIHDCSKVKHFDEFTTLEIFNYVDHHKGFTEYSCKDLTVTVTVEDRR